MVSDIKLYLTQVQYGMIIGLSQSIPKILAGAPEGEAQADQAEVSVASSKPGAIDQNQLGHQSSVKLRAELGHATPEDEQIKISVDLALSVHSIKLHLYDQQATTDLNLKEHGVARFALTGNTLKFKVFSDEATEAQVVLKSFTMSNTRPGNSKFRDIIPAAHHDRNQFMILYTTSGGSEGSSLAILTVDSPNIIFTLDPVFALLEFFTSAFPTSQPTDTYSNVERQGTAMTVDHGNTSRLDFRLDLHNVSISLLENEVDADSQAIRLSVAQVLVSQQVKDIKFTGQFASSHMTSGDSGSLSCPSGHVFDKNAEGLRRSQIFGRS